MKPFVSICIPTYKRTDLLRKLLLSVREQTFRDYEVLINDNSPDDVVATLLKDEFRDLQISYVKNIPSTGAGENCKRVMARATGEWIKVMHDDDWFVDEGALEQLVTTAKSSEADFIFCATKQVWLEEEKEETDLLLPAEEARLRSSFYSLYYYNVIGHPSATMHRRDPLIEYDVTFNWVLDLDYYIRYVNAHGGRWKYIDMPLICIGRSSTQETHKYSFNIRVELVEYLRLLEKYGTSLYLKDRFIFHQLWNMIKRYRIKSISQLREAGYSGALPEGLERVISFQSKIPKLIIKQPPWSDAIMRFLYKRMRTS